MSQDVSTNHKTPEAYADSLAVQPWSADAYADKLMDELFCELDQILDGSNKLPTEPVQPESLSWQGFKMPKLTLSSVIPSSEKKITPPQPAEQTNVSDQALTSEAILTSAVPIRNSNFLFEKILLGITFVVFGSTLFLWLAINKQFNVDSTSSVVTSSSNLSPGDAQFANYIQRSLEVIENKAKTNKSPNTLPTLSNPASGNSIPTSNSVPNVLERVYIPIYQNPPLPSAPVPVVPPTLPSASSVKPTTVKPTTPPAKSTASVKPSPVNLPRIPVPPQAVIPAPTVLAPPIAIPDPLPKHTLVGLLELGDRSAALFEIGGITQRIHVGESIGTSGWNLVAVANQEAIIRRNGEVRSVYVGQKF